MPPRKFVWTAVLLLAIGAGCGSSTVPTGGNYPPVTAHQLIGKQMTHRTGRQSTNFTWVFDNERFVIAGDDIPPDLAEAMLGPGLRSNRIEGSWSIQPGEKIRFETSTGKPAGVAHATDLPIFFTGVIRIQTTDAQYCFPAN